MRPDKHNLSEGVRKCMISSQEAQLKLNEYCDTQGPHDGVYTGGSKTNDRAGAAAVINCQFQNYGITCHWLSKRLPDYNTIFAAEATAITLDAVGYYRHMEPVLHDVVYYDSKACLQAIEGEDIENPLICNIMNLLWLLIDKCARVRQCCIPSHCGIEGNDKGDQSLDLDIDPLARVHYANLKPLINSYIQQLVQIKWGGRVCTSQRTLSLEANTRSTKEISVPNQSWAGCYHPASNWWIRIGDTKATESHIWSWGPPTTCHHCG